MFLKSFCHFMFCSRTKASEIFDQYKQKRQLLLLTKSQLNSKIQNLQLFIIRSCLLYTTSYTSEYTYISIMDRSANADKSELISDISTLAKLPITKLV